MSQFIYGLYILLVQFIELVHFVRVGELHALPHHVVTHEGGRHKIPTVNDDVHHYLRYNIPQKLSTDWEPSPEVASISKIFQQHNRYLHSCWLNRPRGHKFDACAKQVCVDQAAVPVDRDPGYKPVTGTYIHTHISPQYGFGRKSCSCHRCCPRTRASYNPHSTEARSQGKH